MIINLILLVVAAFGFAGIGYALYKIFRVLKAIFIILHGIGGSEINVDKIVTNLAALVSLMHKSHPWHDIPYYVEDKNGFKKLMIDERY